MLAAFDALPDNPWAADAARRLRDSERPELTAALIDQELEAAAAYTAGVYSRWLHP
jgi:hypothetical protein